MQRHAGPLHLNIEDVPNFDRRRNKNQDPLETNVRPIETPKVAAINNKENVRPIEPTNDVKIIVNGNNDANQPADTDFVVAGIAKRMIYQNVKKSAITAQQQGIKIFPSLFLYRCAGISVFLIT